jgi:hypothetical protein
MTAKLTANPGTPAIAGTQLPGAREGSRGPTEAAPEAAGSLFTRDASESSTSPAQAAVTAPCAASPALDAPPQTALRRDFERAAGAGDAALGELALRKPGIMGVLTADERARVQKAVVSRLGKDPSLLLEASPVGKRVAAEALAAGADERLVHAITTNARSGEIIEALFGAAPEGQCNALAAALIDRCLDNWSDGREGPILGFFIDICEAVVRFFTGQIDDNAQDERSINALLARLPGGSLDGVFGELQRRGRLHKLFHDVSSADGEISLWQLALNHTSDPAIRSELVGAALVSGASPRDSKAILALLDKAAGPARLQLLGDLAARGQTTALLHAVGGADHAHLLELMRSSVGTPEARAGAAAAIRAYANATYDSERGAALDAAATAEEQLEVDAALGHVAPGKPLSEAELVTLFEVVGRKGLERRLEAKWNLALTVEPASAAVKLRWTIDQLAWVDNALATLPREHVSENAHLSFLAKYDDGNGARLGGTEGDALAYDSARPQAFRSGLRIYAQNFHGDSVWPHATYVLQHEVGHTVLLHELSEDDDDELTPFAESDWLTIAGWQFCNDDKVPAAARKSLVDGRSYAVANGVLYVPQRDMLGNYVIAHPVVVDAHGDIDLRASGFPSFYATTNEFEQFAETYADVLKDPDKVAASAGAKGAFGAMLELTTSYRLRRREHQYRTIFAHLVQEGRAPAARAAELEQLTSELSTAFAAAKSGPEYNETLVHYDQRFRELFLEAGDEGSLAGIYNAYRNDEAGLLRSYFVDHATWLASDWQKYLRQDFERRTTAMRELLLAAPGSIDFRAAATTLASDMGRDNARLGLDFLGAAVGMAAHDGKLTAAMRDAAQEMLDRYGRDLGEAKDPWAAAALVEKADKELGALLAGNPLGPYRNALFGLFPRLLAARESERAASHVADSSPLEPEVIQAVRDRLAEAQRGAIGLADLNDR